MQSKCLKLLIFGQEFMVNRLLQIIACLAFNFMITYMFILFYQFGIRSHTQDHVRYLSFMQLNWKKIEKTMREQI